MTQNRFEGVETIHELLGQLAGAASTCWEHLDRAGVFQSDLALSYVEDAESYLRELLQRDVLG